MRGVIVAVVCLLATADVKLCAQPNAPTHGTVVGLKDATKHFVELFESTCYQHRGALTKLETEQPAREWQKVSGPFPIREDSQGSSTLVEWGRWSRGVSYKMALVIFDSNPAIISCILFAGHMHKSTLPAAMSRIADLKILKEIQENDNNIAAIGGNGERNLRIVCTTPLEDQLYNGQCALWFASDEGS